MDIGTVKPVRIEDEMRGAYLDYAMSVITARALPDVRDGLKPVQRRILFAMDELSLRHTSPYKKSARIVGEVLGKYHPHGDAPVYETMVRMAQDFSMRYLLVDGQGNFGSVDGDPPAAMRYTEARLAAIAEEMLADIDKNTVDFTPNFDGSLKEPTVLPAKLPNLLLNGSSGIAVGMATNIPPHNLNELADAIVYMIGHYGNALANGVPFNLLWSRLLNTSVEPETVIGALGGLSPELRERVKEEATKTSKRPSDEVRAQAMLHVVDEMIDIPPDKLMEFIKGPDFPTAGIILGQEGIKSAYTTGHGRITLRARAHAEEVRGGRHHIIITQLPFQVNKAALQEKIAELVRDRRIEGISELRDESDRQGMRVVIELKREVQPKQILNQLFKYTAMQGTFSINLLALVDGQPRVLTLKMILLHYINYRKDIITRRTRFDLDRALHREHILQGLKIALDNLDAIISTIRNSRDADTAKSALMKNFKLSEIQAQAILDMQLRRLAALERKKILDELAEVVKLIKYLQDLLANPAKILYLIRDELVELKTKYGDERRTKILAEEASDFSEEDLIPDEPVLVAISGKNYIKRMSADSYRTQRRAKGITGTVSREDDAPYLLAPASTLDQALLFTNRGRAFQIKVFDLPDVGRQAKGLPLSNFISLQPDERVVGVTASRNFDQPGFVIFVTRGGEVKRVELNAYSTARASGLIALSVGDADEVVWAGSSDGQGQVLIVTKLGQVIRFSEDDVRASGRTSGGIRAIRLDADDAVATADIVHKESDLVVVTKNGLGKRTALEEFPVHGRGGGGVRVTNITPKTGEIAGLKVVNPTDDVAVVSAMGSVFRTPVEAIPQRGRSLQVVPLTALDKGDQVTSLLRIEGKGDSKSPSKDQEASPEVTAPSEDTAAGEAPKPRARQGKKTEAKEEMTPAASGAKTTSRKGSDPKATEAKKPAGKESSLKTAAPKKSASKAATAKTSGTASEKNQDKAKAEKKKSTATVAKKAVESKAPAKSSLPAKKTQPKAGASSSSSKPKSATLWGSIASTLSKQDAEKGKAAPKASKPDSSKAGGTRASRISDREASEKRQATPSTRQPSLPLFKDGSGSRKPQTKK